MMYLFIHSLIHLFIKLQDSHTHNHAHAQIIGLLSQQKKEEKKEDTHTRTT